MNPPLLYLFQGGRLPPESPLDRRGCPLLGRALRWWFRADDVLRRPLASALKKRERNTSLSPLQTTPLSLDALLFLCGARFGIVLLIAKTIIASYRLEYFSPVTISLRSICDRRLRDRNCSLNRFSLSTRRILLVSDSDVFTREAKRPAGNIWATSSREQSIEKKSFGQWSFVDLGYGGGFVRSLPPWHLPYQLRNRSEHRKPSLVRLQA